MNALLNVEVSVVKIADIILDDGTCQQIKAKRKWRNKWHVYHSWWGPLMEDGDWQNESHDVWGGPKEKAFPGLDEAIKWLIEHRFVKLSPCWQHGCVDGVITGSLGEKHLCRCQIQTHKYEPKV